MYGSQGIDPNQAAEIEKAKKELLGKILDKEAYERISRVRLANPQLASSAELYLLQLFQAGKMAGKINDKQLKEILTLLSEKREIKIKRR